MFSLNEVNPHYNKINNYSEGTKMIFKENIVFSCTDEVNQ